MEPTMNADAISIRSVRKQRGEFALRDVNLRIPTGFVTGLVGPNGAGKTTLVEAILGLIRPDAGEITLFGNHAAADPRAHDRIGVVLDQVTAAPEWRVGSVGRRVGRLYRQWDDKYFVQLLDRFDVPPGNRVSGLSRGQTVKLSLAMALAHHPDLLVLDEPSSGLDPVARRELGDIIREFMVDPTHTVLFSTHITTELDDLADHLVVVSHGRISHAGILDDVREQFAVVRGAGEFPRDALSSTIGLRRDTSGHWEGLIRTGDSPKFGPSVVVDEATIDDVVVHFAEHEGITTTKEIAA